MTKTETDRLDEMDQRNLRIQEELARRIKQLRRSERGTRACKNLSVFLEEGGVGLDQDNQEAVNYILKCAFNCPWNLPGGYKL